MVNLIYGSLGAVVITLLTLEVAAIILLFGAQIVAEVDRTRRRSHGRHALVSRLRIPRSPPPRPRAMPVRAGSARSD